MTDEEFTEIFHAYKNLIRRRAIQILKDDDDADDALQDTMLNIVRSFKKGTSPFMGDSAFSTWVYKVATNASLMILRKRKLLQQKAFHLASPATLEDPLFQPRDTEHDYQVSDTLKNVLDIIKHMSPEHKEAILFRINGLMSREAMPHFSDSKVKTEGGAKSRVYRARNHLQKNLKIRNGLFKVAGNE
jgi:RNA polymerase sigma-70 factor (ECF subfamily)